MSQKFRNETYIAAILYKISISDGEFDEDEKAVLQKYINATHVNPHNLKKLQDISVDELINKVSLKSLENSKQVFIEMAKADGKIIEDEVNIIRKAYIRIHKELKAVKDTGIASE